MRFQQLKRDPNAIMRKKLVKSKKSWVVVSSLSIAGGLLMMTAPSYVAKADTTTTAPATPTETVSKAPSATPEPAASSNNEGTVTGSDTPSPATPAGTSASDSKGTGTVTPAPVVGENTQPEDTKAQTTEETPANQNNPVTPITKDTDTEVPVEKPADTPNQDVQVVKAAAAPVAQLSATKKVVEAPTEPTTPIDPAKPATETPAADESGAVPSGDVKQEDALKTAADAKLLVAATVPADAVLSIPALDADIAAVPVVEDVTVPTDSGNGWNVTDSGTNLHITGPLDEGTGVDHERWGGNTKTITQVNIEPATGTSIAAPLDSSYLFANMTNLEGITGLDKLTFPSDSSKSVNAEGMFKNDSKIKNIDLSNNTLTRFTNISHMFENDHALETVTMGFNFFKNIIDGSYAFANCESLTDIVGPELVAGQGVTHSMNQWLAPDATDLRGFFKNDISFKTINVYTWAWNSNTETGDSSIGEGMFDGTSLDSIVLNSGLHFNPKTALTSGDGTRWQSTNTSGPVQTFSAMPILGTSNNITNGLGYIYDGLQDHFAGGYSNYTNPTTKSNPLKRLEFKIDKTTASKLGDPIDNIVNVDTDQGPITFTAHGKFGETSIVDVPTSYDFNGHTYNSTSHVQVAFGQMTPTAAVIPVDEAGSTDPNGIVYSRIQANAGNVTVQTTTNGVTSDPITIAVTPNTDTYAGDTLPVTVPIPKGYHTADGADSISVTYDKNGNPVIADTTITLIGDTIPSSTPNLTAIAGPDKENITVTIPEGIVGTTANVKPNESFNGYSTPDITITYTADGAVLSQNNVPIDSTNPIKYIGIATKGIDDSSVAVDQAGNKITVPITAPAGTVGSPQNITIKTPGYDDVDITATTSVNPDGSSVVTYKDKDGKVIDASNPIALKGIATKGIDDSSVAVDQAGNKITVPITAPAGTVGSPQNITIKTPGYDDVDITATTSVNPDGSSVVTYKDKDGKVIDASNPIALKGIATKGIDDSSVAVDQAGNKITVPITAPAGTVGSPQNITIKTPGYDDVDITATTSVNPDGSSVVTYKDKNSNIIDTQNPIKLIGITNNDKKLTLKNPDGTTTKWNIPAGHYGDSPVTLTAKALPGYKAPSVIVTYNASGIPTITNANDTTKPLTETDELSYTRNPSHDGSSAVNPTTTGEGVIESKPQTVSTYSDKPDVELYQLGADNKMSPITSRSLATASNWYSDATITVDGISYFRVATNEWAKVGEVYPYQALNLHIRTYDDSEKDLYKAENVLITKETLAPSSSWITDRETYVINNTKYYRVATNEFVNADDVYVYSPVNMVVTTHADKYTTLYTAKGAEVTNRTLSNDSSWKVDSITYINGDKYYRVATNEFVKASDVDIRNYR